VQHKNLFYLYYFKRPRKMNL